MCRRRRPGQVRSAPAAHQRRAGDDLTGVTGQRHGRSPMTRLSSLAAELHTLAGDCI
jgi:hypothetical protein